MANKAQSDFCPGVVKRLLDRTVVVDGSKITWKKYIDIKYK